MSFNPRRQPLTFLFSLKTGCVSDHDAVCQATGCHVQFAIITLTSGSDSETLLVPEDNELCSQSCPWQHIKDVRKKEDRVCVCSPPSSHQSFIVSIQRIFPASLHYSLNNRSTNGRTVFPPRSAACVCVCLCVFVCVVGGVLMCFFVSLLLPHSTQTGCQLSCGV